MVSARWAMGADGHRPRIRLNGIAASLSECSLSYNSTATLTAGSLPAGQPVAIHWLGGDSLAYRVVSHAGEVTSQ
jgi:hypothetical protein